MKSNTKQNREQKKGLIQLLAQINYDYLTEPQKGFYNEMRTMSQAFFWKPSNEQLKRVEALVNL